MFKYLKYDRLTNKYCNDENSSGNCAGCPVKTECDYYVNHEPPLLISAYWYLMSIPLRVTHAFDYYMAHHKKTHYECAVCGDIEAPYFQDQDFLRGPITSGYGWWKAKGSGKRTCWVCHQCMEHGYSSSGSDEHWRRITWDEHQECVTKDNEKILAKIKEKDPEYYEKWFGDKE